MNDSSNRKVFSWCWTNRSVDAETTVSGSDFQICEAATGKARPQMVESLEWGTSRRSVLAERTRCVSNTSEWSQVTRRGIVKDFVAHYCNLILYGRSVSDWRSVLLLHTEPTGVGALGGQEYPPTRRYHSPARDALGQLPASGMWR